MATVGAFVVGIGAYRLGAGAAFPPLKFAVADAKAITEYLKTCWPRNRELNLVEIAETEATAAAVSEGFRVLRSGDRYEILLVFLSGHGLIDGGSAGFLVQPDDQGQYLVSAAALDALLASIDAARTILILDCCFAEAIVRRMPFFTGLGSSIARLYIASSRETQQTWEDEQVSHGVFTAHLLDVLNTGSANQFGGAKDQLNVDAELFPVLCEQVPLYVFERKGGAKQEPVKGGVSSSGVTLPVARAAKQLRNRTALGTALTRLRQIVTGAALAGVALLFLTYSLSYYIEPGLGGTFIVRHGTRWLEPVLRLLPLIRVDTGIPVSDLSTNSAAAAPLQSGYATGIWTHDSPSGYRGWFTAILAGLDAMAADRYRTLVGEPPLPLEKDLRPSQLERAAWNALSDGRPEALDLILSRIPGHDRLAPALAPFPRNKMDFEILDLTEGQMRSYAHALDYAASLDPVRTFPAYLGFAKATQEWLTYNNDAERGRDAREHVRNDVADGLFVIVRARADRGMDPLDPGDRVLVQGLAAVGYGDVLGLALSHLEGDADSRAAVADVALQHFHGNPEDPAQGVALETIMASLEQNQHAKDIVDKISSAFTKSGNSDNSYYSRFLIAAADTRALSPAIIARIVEWARAGLAVPNTNFQDSEHARILAHAMAQIPTADRPAAFKLIDRVARSATAMSTATAEMYGALGRQQLDPPGMLATVEAQAYEAKPYSPQNSGVVEEPMPGMGIVVGPGPWLAALAEYGQTRVLPARDVALLRDHLTDPALRDVILPALVHQAATMDVSNLVRMWAEQLVSTRRDAKQREIAVMTVVGELALQPRENFVQLIGQLRQARVNAEEPEFRVALGTIIIEAQIARTEPKPRGIALFN